MTWWNKEEVFFIRNTGSTKSSPQTNKTEEISNNLELQNSLRLVQLCKYYVALYEICPNCATHASLSYIHFSLITAFMILPIRYKKYFFFILFTNNQIQNVLSAAKYKTLMNSQMQNIAVVHYAVILLWVVVVCWFNWAA